LKCNAEGFIRSSGVNDTAFGLDEATEPDGSEVDVEKAVVYLLEADGQFCEQMTDIDPVAHPTDPTVLTDTTDLEVIWVGERHGRLGQRPRGWDIQRRRSTPCQRFLRPHRVVLVAERFERALLRSHVGPRLTCRLAFEVEVHVLVRPVLTWAPGLDGLGCDADLDEPDGQRRRPNALDANGVPLSERIRPGSP